MRGCVCVIGMLVSCAALIACEPAGPSAETPEPIEATAPSTPRPAANPPLPPPRYAKAEQATGDAMLSAFYPSPMLVHRCLSLAANGPADQVRDVCTRALALEPGNERIRAALANP